MLKYSSTFKDVDADMFGDACDPVRTLHKSMNALYH